MCCGEPAAGGLLDGVRGCHGPPRAQRGRMAAAEMGLRGSRHPTPFLTWLTPGLLNHVVGAQCGLVILPRSLPSCFGVMVLIFGFLADAVKACDSPEEAGCASSCPAICCGTNITTTTFSRCPQSWGPGVLGRGSAHASPGCCSRGRQQSRPRVWARWL